MSAPSSFLKYTDITQTLYAGGSFAVDPRCNGWVAINEGSDVCVINGKALQPPPGAGLSGESVGMSGNYGEIYDRQSITIVFNSIIAPRVTIIQKVYTNIF